MEISERKKLAGNAFKVNFLMNCYALENAAFGETAAGEEVPFDRYVEELALGEFEPYRFKDCISGTAIAPDGKIAQKSREEFMKECFMFRMELVFASAPKGRTAKFCGGLTSYKYGFGEYIMELFPLFSEIMYTEAEEAPVDGAPAFADRHARPELRQNMPLSRGGQGEEVKAGRLRGQVHKGNRISSALCARGVEGGQREIFSRLRRGQPEAETRLSCGCQLYGRAAHAAVRAKDGRMGEKEDMRTARRNKSDTPLSKMCIKV